LPFNLPILLFIGARKPITPQPAIRSRWVAATRAGAILAAVTGIAFGAALVTGRSFADETLSGVVDAFAAIASGLVVIAAARVAHGRSRLA
jgi:hypothetical protein